MNKYLILELARELKMSPGKVEEICRSFHDGLRELLLKPEEVKGGIMIEGFLTFSLKEQKLKRAVEISKYDSSLQATVLENLQKNKRNGKKTQTSE